MALATFARSVSSIGAGIVIGFIFTYRRLVWPWRPLPGRYLV